MVQLIRLQVPDMPTADEVLPYLYRMDETRIYANRGPLVQELEARLSKICGVPVVTVSNGTLALELALRAMNTAEGWRAYMPPITFYATCLAAMNAGFEPAILDVDLDTWQLSRDTVRDYEEDAFSVAVPVAAFGCPVDMQPWQDVDYPVVVDAAGAFTLQECSDSPLIATCFSMHATKLLGAGEGGFVASANAEWLAEIRNLSMFGVGGTNAKLSEYHAAVALASLDTLYSKTNKMAQVARWYREAGLNDLLKTTNGTSATQLVVDVGAGVSAHLAARMLADKGIETRHWYQPWLDERHPNWVAGDVTTTHELRGRLLGLPFHNFLAEPQVHYIVKTLRSILHENRA